MENSFSVRVFRERDAEMSFYDAVDSLNPFSSNELEKERLKTGIGQQCHTSIFFGVGHAHFPTIA